MNNKRVMLVKNILPFNKDFNKSDIYYYFFKQESYTSVPKGYKERNRNNIKGGIKLKEHYLHISNKDYVNYVVRSEFRRIFRDDKPSQYHHCYSFGEEDEKRK